MDAIKDTINVLKEKRENAEDDFGKLFAEANETAIQLNVILQAPRIVSKQTNRANYETQSVEEYFRKAVYIPLLDNVISDLKDRFSQDILEVFQFNVLLPKIEYNENDIVRVKKMCKFYEKLLKYPLEKVVEAEFIMWCKKWEREYKSGKLLPDSLPTLIDNCDVDLYPTINKLLHIFVTLPISAATAERTFSTLRRVKSWLRTNMSEDRLNGLSLLNVHKDIDIDDIISTFAKGNRKLDFVL